MFSPEVSLSDTQIIGNDFTSSPTDPRSADSALRILSYLQDSALMAFPAFPEAFGRLRLQECRRMDLPLETDGCTLFYNPIQLNRSFLESADRLKCLYLHIHLHCICLHTVCRDTRRMTDGVNTKDRELYWNMACDLSAARLMQILLADSFGSSYLSVSLPDVSGSEDFKITDIPWADPVSLIPFLAQSEVLRDFARCCALDTHCFWYPDSTSDSLSSDHAGSETARISPDGSTDDFQLLQTQIHLWGTLRSHFEKIAGGAGKRGVQGGNTAEHAILRRRNTIDYHRFLQQFAVSREEPVLDMDSFDYIPYHYGMELSDHSLLLLEPLEYKEVNRLDEFAIAIDTSGSCSGRIVRRFLEETWSILRQRENFFSKMRLHLIQCDSMIQEHRIFTSAEEWEAAIPGFQVLGQGNTDFCPVFEYLDRMIQKREIHHLRGLLYFSDGDGIFPKQQPAYETAFVFLKEPDEKLKIPDWVIRLNLNLAESEV